VVGGPVRHVAVGVRPPFVPVVDDQLLPHADGARRSPGAHFLISPPPDNHKLCTGPNKRGPRIRNYDSQNRIHQQIKSFSKECTTISVGRIQIPCLPPHCNPSYCTLIVLLEGRRGEEILRTLNILKTTYFFIISSNPDDNSNRGKKMRFPPP